MFHAVACRIHCRIASPTTRLYSSNIASCMARMRACSHPHSALQVPSAVNSLTLFQCTTTSLTTRFHSCALSRQLANHRPTSVWYRLYTAHCAITFSSSLKVVARRTVTKSRGANSSMSAFRRQSAVARSSSVGSSVAVTTVCCSSSVCGT